MATATAPEPATETNPVLIDLGEASWEGYLDNAEAFFGTVLLAQAAFRTMAEDTAG